MRKRILAGLFLSLTAAISNAALFGRLPATLGGTDYQAVYDTDLNITWMADANLAESSNFGITEIGTGYIFPSAPGTMSWFTAQQWIGAMNNAVYLGVSNWRLPHTVQPDPTCSFQYDPGGGLPLQGLVRDCSASEMGHLFYVELGGGVGPLQNQTLFVNYLPGTGDPYYWSSTEFAPDPSFAWAFSTGYGYQNYDFKAYSLSSDYMYAWPVADGDPLAPVPLPAVGWLLAPAFGIFGWLRRTAGLHRRRWP